MTSTVPYLFWNSIFIADIGKCNILFLTLPVVGVTLGLNLCVISLTAVAATHKSFIKLGCNWKENMVLYIGESNFTLMSMKLPQKKA